ncbi:histone-lysine N-methyltransferase SUVR3 [Ricinus communis]|uniref:Set domain protein, putative n=1 Tax=Ricinus communis TaxID=3988 RepID=B9SI77_RICCO|nr:histone-lysine N-methyltransferase SUVR3 [Ricinus communis]EEF36679.1 set domain protein, putative [Ricinus communis]|eukprot:XP_002525696.1 histone-lysine N-methyltransferase SUVR3 [Ricinus communis]
MNKKQENNQNPLIQWANHILPYLTPQELSNTSLTCKSLLQISKTITLNRSLDASQSFENNNRIPFHNPLGNIPYAYFLYTQSHLLPSQSPKRQSWGGATCVSSSQGDGDGIFKCDCDCEGCEQEDDASGVDFVLGLEEMEMGIMSECGATCECGLKCRNRLTQRGVSVKLKIVRDLRKGWGLFADQFICQGQFVCEYAGELLTTKEARSRQKIYDELTSTGWFSSALLVVREHLPSGKACLRVNIDATRIGNVARFINHSCDGGNLSTMLVRSTGALLPRLCFFASRDIKEGEELTFSYGEIRLRSKGLRCFCGSSCCFGTLPSEHT